MAAKFDYNKTIKELQDILLKLDEGIVPVDELSKMVKRSKKLISACQEHLRKIEKDVNDILDSE